MTEIETATMIQLEAEWHQQEAGYWRAEHKAIRNCGAERRAAVYAALTKVSALAHEQAHHSLDIAISALADDSDRALHGNDVQLAYAIRHALWAHPDLSVDPDGADTSF